MCFLTDSPKLLTYNAPNKPAKSPTFLSLTFKANKPKGNLLFLESLKP